MYILTATYNCPNIPELHNTEMRLMTDNANLMVEWYDKRRNNSVYVGLRVEYYFAGVTTDNTELVRDILRSRGRL